MEHFTAFQSADKDAIASDIQAIVRAGKAGKIVVVKGWPASAFNFTNEKKMNDPPQKLVAEAKQLITFSLACYLVAAQPNYYFCYSWGYREQHGSLVDFPEFHKPLGAPLGAGTDEGAVYTRSFEHATVRVHIAQRTATIDWKE